MVKVAGVMSSRCFGFILVASGTFLVIRGTSTGTTPSLQLIPVIRVNFCSANALWS